MPKNGGTAMDRKIIVTIGREFGSGGREVGEKLAKTLGINFYDKEIIKMAAKESGMSEEVFKKVDETAASSFLYSIATGGYMVGNHITPTFNLPINDKIFMVESDIIREIAARESCVIVGRCADYILRNNQDLTNVFIKAPIEYRVKRAIECYHLPIEKAEEKILKIDKKRANYYNYYTGDKWGTTAGYDICLDISKVGIDYAVELIKLYIEHRL